MSNKTSANIGNVGLTEYTPTGLGGVPVDYPTACTPFHLVCANTTNATVVKNTPGTVKSIQVYNNSATIAYLKFYDSSSAPTAGSAGIKKVVMIPASTSGAGTVVPLAPEGLIFATGIAFVVVLNIGDSDNTAVAASAYLVEMDYH